MKFTKQVTSAFIQIYHIDFMLLNQSSKYFIGSRIRDYEMIFSKMFQEKNTEEISHHFPLQIVLLHNSFSQTDIDLVMFLLLAKINVQQDLHLYNSHTIQVKRISEPTHSSRIPRNKWLNFFLSKSGGNKRFSSVYINYTNKLGTSPSISMICFADPLKTEFKLSLKG